jgi:tetratricopeptide (TPR) repeat protein
MAVFEQEGDFAGQARGWRLLSVIDATAGRYDRAADAAERVVNVASQVDDTRLAARGAQLFAYCVLHGSTPVDEALARCEAVMAHVRADRKAESIVLGILALLRAMTGHFDQARELYQRGREIVADLGPSVNAASTSLEASRVEMLAGDAGAAERELRGDYVVLEAMGETYFRSTIAALLGHALWAQGKSEEAARYAAIARDLTDEDDVLSQVSWRTVEAKSLAAAGQSDAAVALAEEAVRTASRTTDIELHADALLDLGDVLRLVGRMEEQGPHLREALRLYQQKGDLVLAGVARDRLAAVPTEQAV